MIKVHHTEPGKTYPYITNRGFKEMTPEQAKSYQFRNTLADRIRVIVSSGPGAGANISSARWNVVKEMLYILDRGPFMINEKERTKKAKYLPLDLTTFEYEKLDDIDLILIFEMVMHRYNICM